MGLWNNQATCSNAFSTPVLIGSAAACVALWASEVVAVRQVPQDDIQPSMLDARGISRDIVAGVTADLLSVLDLEALLGLGEEEFRQRFRHTSFWRPRRAGMLRNAAIAFGNRGDPAALPILERAAQDEDEIVREAARWAIEQIHQRA